MTLVLSGDSPSFSGTFQGGALTLGTAQNTTSGTAIDFTGIPSWVKRITVMLNGVSTNGGSPLQLQIGAGSIETTGYNGNVANSNVTGYYTQAQTTGFPLCSSSPSASTNALTGALRLSLIGSNTWIIDGAINPSTYLVGILAGNKALSGTLDRIRLTTVNGTDTFDAGSVNILYEG